jgi:hypothetical protein
MAKARHHVDFFEIIAHFPIEPFSFGREIGAEPGAYALFLAPAAHDDQGRRWRKPLCAQATVDSDVRLPAVGGQIPVASVGVVLQQSIEDGFYEVREPRPC